MKIRKELKRVLKNSRKRTDSTVALKKFLLT